MSFLNTDYYQTLEKYKKCLNGKNEKNLARYFPQIPQFEASICPGKLSLFLFQTCGIQNLREALTFSK